MKDNPGIAFKDPLAGLNRANLRKRRAFSTSTLFSGVDFRSMDASKRLLLLRP